MRPATQAEADAFALEMSRRFHARIIRKDMAIEMQLLAALFDGLRALGVQLPVGGDFLNHWATTLGPFIYMPPGLSPDDQIEVLAHEMQHVHQFWGGASQAGLGGGLNMAFLYLVEPEARVRYEVDAYRTGLEVQFARARALPGLEQLVMPLEGGYALGANEHELARDLLEVAATSVSKGVVTTEAGRAALDVLRHVAPDLLDA